MRNKLVFGVSAVFVALALGIYVKAENPTNPIGGVTTTFTLPTTLAPRTIVTDQIPSIQTTTTANQSSVVLTNALKFNQKLDLTVSGDRVVYLTGEVNQGVADRLRALSQKNRPIFLFIDSPGGSVVIGGSILTAMEESESPVYTVCLRICASMAAMIHQYGTNRYMVDRSVLMFHRASGSAQGYVEEMDSRITFFKRYVHKINERVAKRTGNDVAALEYLYASEKWLDAEDANLINFSDATVRLNLEKGATLLPTIILDEKTTTLLPGIGSDKRVYRDLLDITL